MRPSIHLLSLLVLAVLLSAGCQATAAGHMNMKFMTFNGVRRTLLLEQPHASKPEPTIIVLHGGGGNAKGMSRVTGIAELGEREGFASVFANGVGHLWNDGRPAHAREIRRRGVPLLNDAGFLRALVGELVKRRISDRRRIYLAGFSNGGEMTYRMVCEAADLFAAAGAMSALMPEVIGSRCHPAVPMPIVIMAGTADRIVPINGGPLGNGHGRVWSARQTVDFFRKLDGCVGDGEQARLPKRNPGDPTHVTVFRWSDCKAGGVVFYRIEGGGHGIPGATLPRAVAARLARDRSKARRGPANTTELNAAEALWSFFRDKAR